MKTAIDWSKAPEGFDFYICESDCWFESFFRVVDGKSTDEYRILNKKTYRCSDYSELTLLNEGAMKRPNKPVTVPTDPTIYPEVNYKGVIFQIGKFYQSFGADDEWFISKLEGIDQGNKNPFSFGVIRSDNCLEVNQDYIGTVTEAPIELIDGKAYQFDLNGITRNGVYCKLDLRLIWSRGDVAICDCTNIQLLEVKS